MAKNHMAAAMTPIADSAQTSKANAARSSNLMFGHDLGWWNSALVAALALAAIAAFAVVVTTLAVINLQKRDAETAMVTIASLERDAATARLEQEKLKEQLSWRSIPERLATELEKSLAAHPGSVNLRYTYGDPEALALAVQFEKIFVRAKWRVAAAGLQPMNAALFGIWLPDSSGPDALALRAAFKSAGIPFAMSPVRAGMTAGAMIEGAPMLMIGSKAPPSAE